MTLFIIHIIDGHKIATKLSKQITKQTKQVKIALENYNKASAVLDCEAVAFSDVIDLDSSFWKSSYCSLLAAVKIPAGDRHDLIHSYIY